MFLVTLQSSGAKGWTGRRIHGALLARWSVGSKAPPSKAGDASASSDSQLHRAYLQLRIKKSWPDADIRNIANLVPYCKSRLSLEIVYEHIQVTWPLFLFLSSPISLPLFLSFALSLLLSLSHNAHTQRICLTDSIWQRSFEAYMSHVPTLLRTFRSLTWYISALHSLILNIFISVPSALDLKLGHTHTHG